MLHRFRAPQSSAGCIVQDPRLYTMIREQQKAFSVCKQRKTEEWIQTSFRLEWDACLKMLHAKWSRDLRYAGKWKCEFCSNVTEGVDREFATAAAQVDTVDYLLGKAAGWDGKAADAPLLLLCFDASGSMGVSTEVTAPDGGGYGGADAGAGAADGGGGGASAREAAFASVAPLTQAAAEWTCAACTFLNPPEAPLCGVCETMKSEDPRSAHQQQEEEEEAPPSSSHELPASTIYVSRLDSVRLAVDSHLARVAQTHPYHRVGVVVFNDTVAVIGDGTQPTLKIGGDVLLDYDMLFNLGVRAAGTSKAGVAESRGRLMARMQEIESQGQTALGPALLVAVAMCNNAPRSQVMLCTDGLSNVGLGGLAPDATPLEMEYADGFFTRVAETAASQGTTISVISIRGDECNLNSLGVLADMTGGSVARVDALQLSQSIAAIEAPRPQASNVRVRILMHTSLAPFVGGKLMPAMDGLNSHQKRLGNVNAQTQVMFHFCPASAERLAELGKSNPGWPLRFPFQIQITYTPAENPTQERMRVISTDLPVTDAPEQVFPETNLALMSAFAALSTANLARDGEFEAARSLGAAYRDLLSIAMQYQQGGGGGGPQYDAGAAGQEPLYDEAAVTAEEDIYSNYVNAMSQLDVELQAGQGGAGVQDQLVEQAYRFQQASQRSFAGRKGAAGSVPNPVYQSVDAAMGAGENGSGAGAGAAAGYTNYDLAGADANGGYGVIRTRVGSDISGSRHATITKEESLYDTAAAALGEALPPIGHDYAAGSGDGRNGGGESLYASIGPNSGFEIPDDE